LLVDHIPALTTLLIDQCSSITSRDIVTYAEKKGINVSFKQFTDRYGGGRKVRYG
jgi:F-box/TPR repeat protein Pof3